MDNTAQGILAFFAEMLVNSPNSPNDLKVLSTHRDSTGALVVDLESGDLTVRRTYRITIEYIGD